MAKQKLKTKIRFVGSIEQASLLRKFTVLFLMMSLIPTVVLFYFYTQFKDLGQIKITEFGFRMALTFIVLGVLLGYFTMRTVLARLIELSDRSRRNLENIFDPKKTETFSEERNEISVLANSFSEITHRLEQNVKDLELAKRTLYSIMSRLGDGISNMRNIDTFLDLILETITTALRGKVAVLMLFKQDKMELEIKSVYGIKYENLDNVGIKISEGTMIHTVLKSKSPLVMPRVSNEMFESQRFSVLFKAPLICTPLIFKEKVRGVVTISGGEDRIDFEEDELALVNGLASQLAVAIENSRLNRNMETTYFETISALALAVDAKDRYSRGHLDRVAEYCIQIGNKLGLEESDIKTLRDAARLHDIGKIGIPDQVLQKAGPLTSQEWHLMRKHPEIGESIIKPITSLNHLCDIIRHHHEKIDGTGYPDGLKGDEISPLVRILTIADIYDALTTDRSYRKRMKRSVACEEMRKMKDKIDQDIVEAFIETLEEIEVS